VRQVRRGGLFGDLVDPTLDQRQGGLEPGQRLSMLTCRP
jgi:hypothetical protein